MGKTFLKIWNIIELKGHFKRSEINELATLFHFQKKNPGGGWVTVRHILFFSLKK